MAIGQREPHRGGPGGMKAPAPPHARLVQHSRRSTTDDYAHNLGEIAGRLLAEV